MRSLFAAFCVFATLLYSQVSSSQMDGTVTDPTGAAVPAADVTVTNVATGALFKTVTNDRGEWALPSMSAAIYKVSVTKSGFKAGVASQVQMNAGVPATINIRLELGQATEIVEVSGGAELVQTSDAQVSTTLTDKQLTDLPFATRNAIELLVDVPGTSTPTTPRSSTVNGLPKGALNVTIDGMNTQDNMLKSSDGYFSYIMPSVDALEEVTLSTSAAGVDSTGQGGAQIKFVTRSGTNTFHGGGFYQVRNTALDANYFFNNQVGLPRDIVHLRQYGGHLGGPIIKNKLFFFGNVELYRYPGTNGYTRNVFTPSAASGIFTYADAAGALHNVNLLQVAAGANGSLPAGIRPFATTIDPILGKTYSLETQLANNGIIKPNTANGDYNTEAVSYAPAGVDSRNFYTGKIDYNATEKHHVALVYNYDKYVSIPDFLNNIVPILPGGGTVLFSSVNTGQRSNRFAATASLRSALSARLTNELHGGFNGGTVLFFDAVNPGLFNTWRGFYPTFSSPGPNALTNVTATSAPQRRNAPVKTIGDTVSLVRGSHQLSFGGTFDQINVFQSIAGTGVIPRIAMGIAANDPVANGSTNIFTAANFPGANSTQLGYASAMYADLTGRVSSTTVTQALSESTKTYQSAVNAIDRDQVRELGLFVQDQWRINSRLTLNLGLRLEKEFSFKNLDGLYSNVDYQSLWGISGVGHLFSPGATGGVNPVYTPLTGSNTYNMPKVWAPGIGLAYQLPAHDGFLGLLTGHRDGGAVLRAGYSLASIREGMNVYTSIYGANQGVTQDASVSPSTYPASFGAPGSVQFSDPNLPTRPVPSSPQYPITPCFTCSLNGFSPNLKLGYVQSWNVSFQRELNRSTVIEIRYNGNHGVNEWRQLSLNEVNIFENGFLNEFNVARNNLAIARGGNIYNNTSVSNFGNTGLAGQANLPIIGSALANATNNSTYATYLMMGQAGTFANALATNATFMNNLTAAKYPANFFVVNPTVGGTGSYALTNGGSSYYDAGVVEVRRRLVSGLQVQASYTLAKSLADGATASSSVFSQPTTLRNYALDKVPQGFDIRNAIKFNWIYELPLGQGRKFLSSSNPVVRKAVEGWEIAGVARLQSGTPLFLNGLGTYNNGGAAGQGVVLHNITRDQLQSMVGVYKTSLAGPNGGIVYYLPPPTTTSVAGLNSTNNTNLITNTMAAFNVGGLTPASIDPNAPYISPAAPGQLGWEGYLYLPWQRHFDVSLTKHTKIRERVDMVISARALNVFNITNFLPGSINTSSTFGYVTSAYRDISGTVDPGGRILEFQARINF
jgi:Carboxypeptidase regulatory-like domain